jgi:hypothetical protein
MSTTTYGPCGFYAECTECGSTRETVTRDAELMEEVQGFPLPDSPICCEVPYE